MGLSSTWNRSVLTRIHVGVDLKGLVPGIDAAVPEELLTQPQRRVGCAVLLKFMIADCVVVQKSKLEGKTE